MDSQLVGLSGQAIAYRYHPLGLFFKVVTIFATYSLYSRARAGTRSINHAFGRFHRRRAPAAPPVLPRHATRRAIGDLGALGVRVCDRACEPSDRFGAVAFVSRAPCRRSSRAGAAAIEISRDRS